MRSSLLYLGRSLSILFALVLVPLACGEDGEDEGGDGGTEGFCQIGTADCSCSAQFACVDAGYFCVDSVCVECPDGDQDCACNMDGTCNAGLECVNPDPMCMVNCDPSTCQPAGN